MIRWLRSLEGYPRAAVLGALAFLLLGPILAVVNGVSTPSVQSLLLDALLLAGGGAIFGAALWQHFLRSKWFDESEERGFVAGLLSHLIWPVAAVRLTFRVARGRGSSGRRK